MKHILASFPMHRRKSWAVKQKHRKIKVVYHLLTPFTIFSFVCAYAFAPSPIECFDTSFVSFRSQCIMVMACSPMYFMTNMVALWKLSKFILTDHNLVNSFTYFIILILFFLNMKLLIIIVLEISVFFTFVPATSKS